MTTTTTPAITTTTTVTREAAESITAELREASKGLAKARTRIGSLVKSAKSGNVHTVMGFKSWPAYVADVLGDLKGLSQADHEWLLHLMAGEGMSSRAIARALGISQSTANRMVKAMVETGKVAKDRDVAGTDGKTRNAAKSGKAAAEAATVHPAVKAAKAYAAAVSRLAESDGFDLATLEGDTLAEVLAALEGTRSNMVRVAAALKVAGAAAAK